MIFLIHSFCFDEKDFFDGKLFIFVSNTQLLFSMQCLWSKIKTEWQLAGIKELLNMLFIVSYSL